MPIVVVGLSHRSCPVEVRERFAFSDDAAHQALDQMRQSGLAEEGVIVSTCNRVEVYAATPLPGSEACARIQQFLCESRNCREVSNGEIYAYEEPRSVEHLFKVASGLDSMVLGETEILGQIKKAYDLALSFKHTGSRLNKAFQRAFNVAKQIRTETNIQRGSTSVASVAVELAEKIFDDISERQVMVLGAGDTSEKTARALMSRGAKNVIVSNRTHERAVALANDLGGRAVRFEEWANEFVHVDIVISSTSAPGYVLDRARLDPLMRMRRHRSLLLIDIAVPRDIDPEVNRMENVYLYNIDDLQAIAEDYLRQRQEEVKHCEAIIREKALALLQAPNRPPTA